MVTEEPEPRREAGVGRRALLAGFGAAAVAGVTGWTLGRAGDEATADGPREQGGAGQSGDRAPASLGEDAVPGVTAPATPQRHCRLAVLQVADEASLPGRLQAAAQAGSAEDEDADKVTVTLGVAPEVAAALWGERVAHAAALPPFANDAADLVADGNVLVSVSAETAAAAAQRESAVLAALPGEVVWRAAGYRDSSTPEGTARTGIGFIDGIINPRDAELLAAGVWTSDERRDTYLVVRRMRIDEAFTALPRAEQERAIGRDKATGAPLSGGGPLDEVDLFAKNPDGTLVTPSGSHARRAHPSHIGRPLMLRRSYTLASASAGLLFMAFLNDPSTFVLTQRRLDEQDDLIAHTRTDASGVFFVPEPGTF